MKKTIITLLLLSLCIWLYIQSNPAEKEAPKPMAPNVVTFEESIDLNAAIDDIKKEKKKETTVPVETEFIVTERQDEAIELQKEKTYWQVYQQLKLARNCELLMPQVNQNDSPEQWLTDFSKRVKNDQTYQPPQAQLNVFGDFIVACESLMEQYQGVSHQVIVGDEGPKYPDLTLDVQDWLEKTKPQSPQEKAIAKALSAAEQWQQVLNDLLEISEGTDSLSAEELKELLDKKAALRHQLYQPKAFDSEQEFRQAYAAIEEIEKQLAGQKVVDEQLRNQVLADFNSRTSELFEQLYQGEAEVFVIANQALNLGDMPFEGQPRYQQVRGKNFNELLPEYVFPMTINQQLMGGLDSEWLWINGIHIDQLYYCQLGGDCSASSLLSWQMCLPLPDWNFNVEACDKLVNQFIEDQLLSPNQRADIQIVLDWLEAQYGS